MTKEIPASEEEVIEYCRERGLSDSDGSYMWFHWQCNGFTIGGKPVKSWKAQIRSWQVAGYMPSQKPQKNGNGSQQHYSRRLNWQAHNRCAEQQNGKDSR